MLEEKQFHKAKEALIAYMDLCEGKGFIPLSRFLQSYFREHRNMGSRDRKFTSVIAYNFFRLGHICKNLPIEKRISISCFLCEKEIKYPALEYTISQIGGFKKGQIGYSQNEKIIIVKDQYPCFKLDDLFSFQPEWSNGLYKEKFYQSFFSQPKVWLRLRKDFATKAMEELSERNISFHISDESSLALSVENNVSLEELESRKKAWFEVQDLSSQKTGVFLQAKEGESWWDCCSGSGGKSLMLKEMCPSVKLLVSDVRPTIMENLKVRFKKAGIKDSYKSMLIDLMKDEKPDRGDFDGIIVDAPCSGSGTWSRTPEMLWSFDERQVSEYQEKQKTITANAAKYLKPGKKLIYITCSVFRAENEEFVEWLSSTQNLKIQSQELISGYDKGADSLFVAVLVKGE
jgi:16S rRNA (cytosine967-C5)-methyltransferase